ncbi:hypothetical protein C8R46DRAFT_1346805 [Mycena filopes]|nr:hypothetical protein C8R46DRAFT_1346805 [Mycena filopes]
MPANTSTATAPFSISSGVTFVINTQGPGPFTFNINLSGATSTDSVTFTVNTEAAPASTSPAQQPAPCRQFLLPISQSNREVSEVPETPQGPLSELSPRQPDYSPLRPLHLVRRPVGSGSQSVQAPGSAQSSLADCSDTEDSIDVRAKDARHQAEPVASLSPSYRKLAPSRKRTKLESKTEDSPRPSQRFRSVKPDPFSLPPKPHS